MNITTPISDDVLKNLKSGDNITISGIIYTARDAAHKRMCEALECGGELPFDISGQIIYYVGPCPSKPGEVIGSCGPTTSYRMDAYAPRLIKLGLKGMIGKGLRSDEVKKACKDFGCVYFGAIGGAGALLSQHVKKSEVIAYDVLGTEAVRKLTVENFPVTVIMDIYGNDLYQTGKIKYRNI